MIEEATAPVEVPVVLDTKSFSINSSSVDEVKYTKAGEKTVKVNLLEVDNLEQGRRLRVLGHPNGLVIELVPRYRYYYKSQEDRIIIPGQYTDINQVSKFIIQKSQVDKIRKGEYVDQATLLMAQKLKSSGLWESRGKLKWRNVPDDFWKVVSIENFSIGTIKSYYQWWLSALLKKGAKTNGTKGKWYVKDSVHKDVENGEVPEKLNSIRYWNQLTFDDLMNFVSRGWSSKKQWGPFVTQVRGTFYESLMLKHNDWTDSENFEAVVEYLARCPKSERMSLALNSLSNSGLDALEIVGLNLLNAKEVEKAANYSVKFQSIYRQNKKHLNSTYKPPVLKNVIDEKTPENNFIWNPKTVWADSMTFPNLSDWYSCCISRYGSYEDNMVNGRAHALYHEDHTPENKGGFLAYIAIREDYNNRYNRNNNYPSLLSEDERIKMEEAKKNEKWEVQEISCFNNGSVTEEHMAYAKSVADQLNKQLPGAHAPVKEITKDELIAELVSDPIGAQIKALWENNSRRRNGFRY